MRECEAWPGWLFCYGGLNESRRFLAHGTDDLFLSESKFPLGFGLNWVAFKANSVLSCHAFIHCRRTPSCHICARVQRWHSTCTVGWCWPTVRRDEKALSVLSDLCKRTCQNRLAFTSPVHSIDLVLWNMNKPILSLHSWFDNCKVPGWVYRTSYTHTTTPQRMEFC